MAIGSGNSSSNTEAAPQQIQVPQTQAEFLYLREALAALDLTEMSLSLLIGRIQNAMDNSEDLRKFFDYIQVINQVLVSAGDLVQKVNEAAISVEGALQAVSALELSRRATELSKRG